MHTEKERPVTQEKNIRINLVNGNQAEEELKRLCRIANQLNAELEKANSLISKLASSMC